MNEDPFLALIRASKPPLLCSWTQPIGSSSSPVAFLAECHGRFSRRLDQLCWTLSLVNHSRGSLWGGHDAEILFMLFRLFASLNPNICPVTVNS
jgi:hypothetical protein